MNPGATILVVAPYFPPHGGGLERYAYEVARQYATQGFRVIVVTSGESDSRKEEDGLTIYRLRYDFKISNTPISFSWLWKVRRIMRDEKPDLLHIHAPVCGMPDIAALVGNVPYIVTYHSGSMKKGRLIPDIAIGIYEFLLLPILFHRAAALVSASDAVREDFLLRYNDVEVIPPAVDHTRFIPGTKKDGTILFVAADISTATEYKGLGILVDAMALLHARGVVAQLAVVGDGDMRQRYEKRVREKGLAHVVRFLGRLQGADLINAYKDAALFVLPTANDSYPISILEAMSAALPIIATRIGDIPRIVEDGVTGFLVPRDVEPLAEKLEILVRDVDKAAAFGAAGRRKVVREYSWEERARGYTALFSRLLRPEIVHVSAYYPPHVGGAEQRVQDLVIHLAGRGCRVCVLTTNIGSTGARTEHGVTITRMRAVEIAHTPIAPALLWRLFRIPKRSIIHLHVAQAYFPEVTALIAKIRGIPYIAHVRAIVIPSGFFGMLLPLYFRFVLGPVIRASARVVVLTPDYIDIVHERFSVPRENITVIPNATTFRVMDVPRKRPRSPARLLAVGRISTQKNYPLMLAVARDLQERKIPFTLTIAGDGEGKDALVARSREQALPITYAGNVLGPRLEELYERADLFLHTSVFETFGTVFIEAMAKGLPIVAPNVPGTRNVVQDGESGILTTADPKQLADAVVRILSDTKLYASMSQANLRAVRQYDWDTITEDVMRMYEHIRV